MSICRIVSTVDVNECAFCVNEQQGEGVNILNYRANSLVSLEWKENMKYLGDLIDSK